MSDRNPEHPDFVMKMNQMSSVCLPARIGEYVPARLTGALVHDEPDDSARPKMARKPRTGSGEQVMYENLARFRFALRQFLAFSEATTSKAGVTPQQYQALLVIQTHSDRDGATIRDIADRLLLQHHGGVQLIDRLVAMGLVERRRSELDRRKVIVSMTAEGTGLLRRLALAHRDELLKQEPLLAESLARLRRIARP